MERNKIIYNIYTYLYEEEWRDANLLLGKLHREKPQVAPRKQFLLPVSTPSIVNVQTRLPTHFPQTLYQQV